MKVRELVLGALLTALALVVPLVFRGWLQVYIPPFSATLASHVPSMMAMFISPMVAGMVGLGSSLGFLVTLGPVIAGRAFIHVIFGVVGALLLARGAKPWLVLFALTPPIHAAGEALVVALFGFQAYEIFVAVGLGTLLHHMVDAAITVALMAALARSGVQLGFPAPVGLEGRREPAPVKSHVKS